jgi:hypothetical protein
MTIETRTFEFALFINNKIIIAELKSIINIITKIIIITQNNLKNGL